MSRLDDWINEEVASYEEFYGTLGDKREAFEEQLRGTLHAAQLDVADSAGTLGDSVLAELKSHSDRLRDSQLSRWFRSLG